MKNIIEKLKEKFPYNYVVNGNVSTYTFKTSYNGKPGFLFVEFNSEEESEPTIFVGRFHNRF